MHPSDTNLNRIKYCLQGGESLREEVIPDFSQNLNETVTYTRERRWEKEEKRSLLTGRPQGSSSSNVIPRDNSDSVQGLCPS